MEVLEYIRQFVSANNVEASLMKKEVEQTLKIDEEDVDELESSKEKILIDGYDEEGFDENGYSRDGYHKITYENGYQEETGLDPFGFDRFGFDKEGYGKIDGKDMFGFYRNGLNDDGCSIWGIFPGTGLTSQGTSYIDSDSFDLNKVKRFNQIYHDFISKKCTNINELVNAFYYGIGTISNLKNMVQTLVFGAYVYKDTFCLKFLSEIFKNGEIFKNDETISNYFLNRSKGDSTNFYQFKADENIKFIPLDDDKKNLIKKEQEKVDAMIEKIVELIEKQNSMIKNPPSIQGHDDYEIMDFHNQSQRNEKFQKSIEAWYDTIKNPYFERVKLKDQKSNEIEEYYITEMETGLLQDSYLLNMVNAKDGSSANLQKNDKMVELGKNTYDFLEKVKVSVKDGKVEFVDNLLNSTNENSKETIKDDFLLHILESRRGDKEIHSILSTIQNKQDEIVRYDRTKNVVVQGCAGSGKTTVLLHRLAQIKFDDPRFNYKEVKIITPNVKFSDYVKKFAKKLNIEEINRLTLQEYYVTILEKYYNDHSSMYSKQDIKNNNKFTISAQRKNIAEDSDWSLDVANYVYSESFRTEFMEMVEKTEMKNNTGFFEAMEIFNDVFYGLIKGKGYERPRKNVNYLCVLYAKVLFLSNYYKNYRFTDKLLSIDEGQDIALCHYVLLKKVNLNENSNEDVVFNVYGDINQKLVENINLDSWEKLCKVLDENTVKFEMNQNYRNSSDIVNFYNKELSMNDQAISLPVKNVQKFSVDDLYVLVYFQLLLGNQVAIISNNKNEVPSKIKQMINGATSNLIGLYTVKEAKGMEFDTAIIFDEDMSNSDKYISYTRAINELYVFGRHENLNGWAKMFCSKIKSNENEKSINEIITEENINDDVINFDYLEDIFNKKGKGYIANKLYDHFKEWNLKNDRTKKDEWLEESDLINISSKIEKGCCFRKSWMPERCNAKFAENFVEEVKKAINQIVYKKD